MKAAKYALLGFLGLVVVVVAWGLIEPHFIDTEEHAAEIPNLPESWDGKRVA